MRTWRTDYALTVGYPNAPQNAFVHGGFFYSFNASALAPNITGEARVGRAPRVLAPGTALPKRTGPGAGQPYCSCCVGCRCVPAAYLRARNCGPPTAQTDGPQLPGADAVLALRARHPDAPVYVTGHSLGGALATVCAMHVKLLLGVPDVRVFTFGSPRVGNSIFATWFEKEIKVGAVGGWVGGVRFRGAGLLIWVALVGGWTNTATAVGNEWCFGVEGTGLWLTQTCAPRVAWMCWCGLWHGQEGGPWPQGCSQLTAHLQPPPPCLRAQVHYRFTHDRDIVPSVPPTYMGFYHVSREVRHE